jgi:hypothetical protein
MGMRKLALLLAAAILPACESDTRRDNVHVSVHNQGATESARVRIQVRRANHADIDREAIVLAGDSVLFEYDDVTRVALQAFRVSDGLTLFDDFWNADDLRHLHDTVDVTVTP